MPHSNSGSDSDRSSAQSTPLFGGRSSRHSAAEEGEATEGRATGGPGTGEPGTGEPGKGDAAASGAGAPHESTHSLRVASGKVVKAEADADAAAGDQGKGVRTVVLPPINTDLPLAERAAEVMRLAQDAFSQTGYWISFYRALFSEDGVLQTLFPTSEEMAFFEETPEFVELHKMMTALRSSDVEKIDAVEPQTMITIRMPRSLRAVLVQEAEGYEVSINKLCISKLLLPISAEFVPVEKGRVRGRKPGNQSRSNRSQSNRSQSKRSQSRKEKTGG